MTRVTAASIAYVATQVCIPVHICFHNDDNLLSLGPIRAVVLVGVLSQRYDHRFGEILQLYSGFT